jgi:hypothetical protein
LIPAGIPCKPRNPGGVGHEHARFAHPSHQARYPTIGKALSGASGRPLLYAQTTKLHRLPVYVAQLYGIDSTVQPWPSFMAAAVLTTVPLFIVFFLARRFILESVVLSGLKG